MTSRPSEPRRYYWDEEERVLRNKPKGQNWHLILVPESAYDALRQQLAEMRGAWLPFPQNVPKCALGIGRDSRYIVWIVTADSMAYWGVRQYRLIVEKDADFGDWRWCTGSQPTDGRVTHFMEGPSNPNIAAALAPTSQPSREPECACGHPYACGAAERPSRATCETCKGFKVVNVDDWHQTPCQDCTQPSLPAGSLAAAIEDAQRTVAGWPEDVRAAIGVQPERQGEVENDDRKLIVDALMMKHIHHADHAEKYGTQDGFQGHAPLAKRCKALADSIMDSVSLPSPPHDDIVAGLRTAIIGLKFIKESDVKGGGTWYDIQYAIACFDRAIAALGEKGAK